MKEGINIKEMNIKEINQELNIGKEDVSLWMEASIDGKVVQEERLGDSLLASFLNGLYSLMGSQPFETQLVYDGTSIDGHLVDIIEVWDEDPIRLDPDGTLNDTSTGERVQIMGIDGNDAINGVHVVTLTGSEITLDGVPANGSESLASNPVIRPGIEERSDRADRNFMNSLDMKIGRGNTPSDLSMYFMEDEIPEGSGINNRVEVSGHNVSTVGVAGQISEINITRDFTNNGLDILEIREVGLYARMGDAPSSSDEYYALMARDLVNITLNIGKTVTITYRIKTTNTSSGGILKQFLRILRRQISADSYDVNTIDDSLHSLGDQDGQFFAAGLGGKNRSNTNLVDKEGQYVGPQVGVGTSSVDVNDYALETRCNHGDQTTGDPVDTNELWNYPTLVDNFNIDIVGGEAYFDIIKFFENKGSTTVTINECGLYVAYLSNGNFEEAYCIARHQVSPGISLSTGEIAKLTYRIKLTV